MFGMKKIFLNYNRLTCSICTSSVTNCEKPCEESRIVKVLLKKGSDSEKRNKRNKFEYPEIAVSLEEKQKAKLSLKALLENMKFEVVQKEEKETDLGEMLKMQMERRKARERIKKNFEEFAIEAANNVAEKMGGDKEKVKRDLLSQLMTIDFTQEKEVSEKIPQPAGVSQITQEPAPKNPLLTLENYFSSERLRIFEKSSDSEVGSKMKLNVWDKLEQEDLAYRAAKPPKNQFEEWLWWTEQGRLWLFPIDNDQGREAEATVDFTEHVFLDEHLEPWCPKKGPLKKFMDLVLVGLSKNPHLTLEEKKEHIFWYRDYFENKKQLLQQLGALGSAKEIGESANPQKNQQKSS